jgi:peptidoglycan/LPS O-acetylase OafA/YrhL
MQKTSRLRAHPEYRPEIDGLRAIAVLAVVCFHAFPSSIRGGFIGVDIFFVISGFLISTIILQNLALGQFSLSDFYQRRIKRIFPALGLVLSTCLAFGWLALLADEYKQLGIHTASGAAFISNFVFWRESGYFDNASETKPLLHLWSLAIEEQFYIIWPLLLWIAWKLKINLLLLTIVLLLLSFALNVSGIGPDKIATFYSPQTRAWELLTGAIIAHIGLTSNQPRQLNTSLPRHTQNILSLLGLSLLVIGFFFTTNKDAFPGWIALLPVVGTAVIIWTGSNTWLSKHILSHPLLVWFGLISFPLYLWHWPLLSFARIIESEIPSKGIRLAAICIAILFAWLTYRFLEKPIRTSPTQPRRTALMLVAAMLGVGLLGVFVYKTDGLEARRNATPSLHEGETGHSPFHQYIYRNYSLCAEKTIADGSLRWEGMVQCGQSKDDPKVDVALIGDSHAEHVFIGLAEGLKDKNVAFFIRNSAPYLSNPEYSAIYAHLIADRDIKQVVLTMWWIGRITPSTKAEILRAAGALIDTGKEVFITDDVPNFPFDPQKCRGRRWLSTSDPTCTMSQAAATEQAYVHMLSEIVKADPRIKLISTQTLLCNGRDCNMTRDGKLLYRDYNHLNVNGSKYVGEALAKEILNLQRPRN